MKKARANTNDYWDKKLLEVEEKDPNRWRHTGYKKMYIQGESSSGESDREADVAGVGSLVGASSVGGYRYNSNNGPPPPGGRYGRSRSPRSRSHSRLRKTPPLSPPTRRRSPPSSRDMINRISRSRGSPLSSLEGQIRGVRPRSPPRGGQPRSPLDLGSRRPNAGGVRPRSPQEPPSRRKSSRSPIERRRGSPSGMSMARRRASPSNVSGMASKQRGQILPRSKRPPSPPPRVGSIIF